MFDEVRLPTDIEKNALGGPGFLTTVSILNSGKEQRNSVWEVDRGRWDIGYGVQIRADADAIRNFFMARLGKAKGFRFKDWSNYTTLTTRMPTNEEGDQSETEFQLWFRYQDTGNFYYDKQIFKPVASTIKMFVDGSEVSGFTVDDTTGRVTFDSAPEYGANIEWTGDFDLPVRFDTDHLQIEVYTKEVLSQPRIPIIELKL